MLTVIWHIEIQTFRHNGVSFTDNNSAPYLQMDSPSERDLKSQLRAYDKRINGLTEDVEYDEVKRKLENRVAHSALRTMAL